jgi:Mg-chelatase subunit ChlD
MSLRARQNVIFMILITLHACGESSPKVSESLDDLGEREREDLQIQNDIIGEVIDELSMADSPLWDELDTIDGWEETPDSEGEISSTDAHIPDSGSEEIECDDSFVVFLKPDESMIADVMLVVDRSGSMNDMGKWEQTKNAVQSLTSAMEDNINFGLMLFPDPTLGFFGDECASGAVLVSPETGTALEIATMLNSYSPLGGTPTASSLRLAGDLMISSNPEGPNFILLATDGGPGCNATLHWPECTCIPGAVCPPDNNCLDDVRTLSIVEDLYEQNISTFVIGIPGSELVSDLLDAMAVAGGTDIEGEHYAVDADSDILMAMTEIGGSVVPCRYELDEAPSDPEMIVLSIDGVEILRDITHEDGWDISDEIYIDLYGSACTQIRDGGSHSIDVLFDCER